MTEIPEHLLQRSRERRQALGLPTEGGAPSAAAAPAAASPAPVATSAPAAAPAPKAAPAPPPPPKPDPPYVAAAKNRKRVPYWAMGALSLLPMWMFLYVRGLTPDHVKLEGPLASGATIYGKCASCHGGDGSGGSGRPLDKGEVLKTFPKIEDQLNFVFNGSEAFTGKGFGDPNRAGGQHVAGQAPYLPGAMPKWGAQISAAEILAAVCYERYGLSGGDRTSAEFLAWCSPTSENYSKLTGGGTFADVKVSTAVPS